MDPLTQLCLEVAKLAVTTLASGVAAYFAIKIATSQRDIAKRQAETALEQRRVATAKLNLDLFDRRYELFMEVWGFLSHGAVGDVTDPSDPKFTNLIPKARFLFGDDIANYMSQASSKKTQMALANKQKTSAPYATPQTDQELYELGVWFQSEATNCFKRFADHLDFSHWRAEPVVYSVMTK